MTSVEKHVQIMTVNEVDEFIDDGDIRVITINENDENDNITPSSPCLPPYSGGTHKVILSQVRSAGRKPSSSDAPHSPARRKLSESRGVILPDIKIVQPLLKPDGHLEPGEGRLNIPTGLTPPSAVSPLGNVMVRFPSLSTPKSPSTPSAERLIKGLLEICIFLPDQHGIQFTIEGGRIITAGGLHEMVSDHLGLPASLSGEVFALWMVSPLLEVQLKAHHMPFQVRRHWPDMLKKFTRADGEMLDTDEPLLMFRRNVLLTKIREKELCWSNEKALEILYLDCREAVLNEHCLCDLQVCLQLAAIQMVLSCGPYDKSVHTHTYVRDRIASYVPPYWLRQVKSWTLFGRSLIGCHGMEHEIIDQYQLFSSQNHLELYQKYLEICYKLPFYGAAQFAGHIEPSAAMLWERIRANELPVRVSINREFICVVDVHKHTLLLCVPLLDCNWRKMDFPLSGQRPPTSVSGAERQGVIVPSFLLHFPDPEEEGRSRLLQVFSKQAVMMCALLDSSVDASLAEKQEQELRNRVVKGVRRFASSTVPMGTDETDGLSSTQAQAPEKEVDFELEVMERCQNSDTLRNKLDRLPLATFDSNGSY